MPVASGPQSAGVMAWVQYLAMRPWSFEHRGQVRFSGFEMTWAFALGCILYLRGYGTAGGSAQGEQGAGEFTMGAKNLSDLFCAFDDAMAVLAEEYSYPGRPPSMKYSVVSTRSYYLAYLLRNADDVFLDLLRSITQMVCISCCARERLADNTHRMTGHSTTQCSS